MGKRIKQFLGVAAGVLLAVTLFSNLLSTPPDRPPTSAEVRGLATPAPTVATPAPTETPRLADLWDLAYYLKTPLDIQYRRNCAADVNEAEQTILYSVWIDGLDAYALDEALVDYEALTSWRNIRASLTARAAELEAECAALGWPEVRVGFRLVDPQNFELVYLSASAEQIEYDAVDQTPPGELLSKRLYSQEDLDPAAVNTYVLNRASGVFHRPGCSAAERMDAANRETVSGSRREMIAAGHTACRICCP